MGTRAEEAMKRLGYLLLVCCVALGLAGCGAVAKGVGKAAGKAAVKGAPKAVVAPKVAPRVVPVVAREPAVVPRPAAQNVGGQPARRPGWVGEVGQQGADVGLKQLQNKD